MDSKHTKHPPGRAAPAPQSHAHKDGHTASQRSGGHYGRLAVMAGMSFVAMFVLMYAMVDVFASVFINVNQFYMAGLMTAPMIVIELLLMAAMYRDRKLNVIIIAGSLALLTACWIGIRRQVAIGDSQFLRSMIPHHAGAILMCEESSITDSRIKALCEQIRESQTREIAEMKVLLQNLK